MASTDPTRNTLVRVALILLPVAAVAFGAPRLYALLRPSATKLGLGGGGAAGKEPLPAAPGGATSAQFDRAREAQLALGEARRSWESSKTIAPRAEQAGEDGLPTRWFDGFGVEVDSVPAGASVRANGKELGETPLLASVACKPGEDVRVRVEKRPLAAWERTVRCREDTVVKLKARLGAR